MNINPNQQMAIFNENYDPYFQNDIIQMQKNDNFIEVEQNQSILQKKYKYLILLTLTLFLTSIALIILANYAPHFFQTQSSTLQLQIVITLIIIFLYFFGGLIIIGLTKFLHTLKDVQCFSGTSFCLFITFFVLYLIGIIGFTLLINFLAAMLKCWDSEESSDPKEVAKAKEKCQKNYQQFLKSQMVFIGIGIIAIIQLGLFLKFASDYFHELKKQFQLNSK